MQCVYVLKLKFQIVFQACCYTFLIRKDIKEQWDHRKSLKQNLQSLNLFYNPNEVATIDAVAMVRLMLIIHCFEILFLPIQEEEQLIPKATHKIPSKSSSVCTLLSETLLLYLSAFNVCLWHTVRVLLLNCE